jgi:hypothetical protein
LISDLSRATVVPARPTYCFFYALQFQARQLRSGAAPIFTSTRQFAGRDSASRFSMWHTWAARYSSA